MSFYTSIADVYREIFPLNMGQVQFVNGRIPDPGHRSLLDIGCGTGDLTLELAGYFEKVVGIDLDTAMLEKARKDNSTHRNVQFLQMNMLEIGIRFGSNAFDTVLCFGNTLVHLNNKEDISRFLSLCRQVIKPEGKLMIQIINYDRILDQQVQSLPTIDNKYIQFVRNYHYLEDIHMIDFETILTIKASNQIIRNSIHLFPLRKSDLESLLPDSGFNNFLFFGNFKMELSSVQSIPLVIEATG